MKRLLLSSIVALFAASSLFAQNSDIRLPQRPDRPNYREHARAESGFWCAAELEGIAFLNTPDIMPLAGINLTAGYRFSEFIRIGAGIGFDYYITNTDQRFNTAKRQAKDFTFPIYLNARGNIISQYSRTLVPYWSANVGVAVNDGFYFQPTIGLRFGDKRDSWLVGIGFTVQHLDMQKAKDETGFGAHLKVGYEF